MRFFAIRSITVTDQRDVGIGPALTLRAVPIGSALSAFLLALAGQVPDPAFQIDAIEPPAALAAEIGRPTAVRTVVECPGGCCS